MSTKYVFDPHVEEHRIAVARFEGTATTINLVEITKLRDFYATRGKEIVQTTARLLLDEGKIDDVLIEIERNLKFMVKHYRKVARQSGEHFSGPLILINRWKNWSSTTVYRGRAGQLLTEWKPAKGWMNVEPYRGGPLLEFGEVLFRRARNVIRWLLAMELPVLPAIDWALLSRTCASCEIKGACNGRHLLNIFANQLSAVRPVNHALTRASLRKLLGNRKLDLAKAVAIIQREMGNIGIRKLARELGVDAATVSRHPIIRDEIAKYTR